MPKEIVLTPGDKLDVLKIMAEKNVDVRRESLRKIPIERIIKDTGAQKIDEWKNETKKWCWYELFSMHFGDGKIRKVLRMKNPSVDGAEHFERVEDDCETIKQALCWRNGQEDYLKPNPEFYERELLT